MRRIFKIAIPTLLIGLLSLNIVRDWETASVYLKDINVYYFIFIIPAMLVIYPEGAYAWFKLLSKMGFKTKLRKTLFAWIVSNTARYIPGTIWQYVGRVELGKSELGLKRKDVLMSVLAEVFFTIAGGALIALVALPYLSDKVADGFSVGPSSIWVVFLLPLPFIILHPKISTKFINIIAKVAKKDMGRVELDVGFGDSLSLLFWFSLNFVMNGIALFLLAVSFGIGFSPGNLLMLTGFFAFSWMVGYFTLIAPGGVGVTEVSLTFLMSLYMPTTLAAVIALVYRVLLTVSEMIVFVLVLKLKKNEY